MRLEFETRVPAPIESVFRFHESPDNLALLLEGWRGFSLLRHAGGIDPGSTTWVVQRVAWFLPVVMAFRHTVLEPPARFAEEMFHGPYRRFEHTHEFEDERGATRVRDRLSVCLPACYGGEAATRALIAPWMRRLFAFRHRRLDELARTGVLRSEARRPAGGRGGRRVT